MALAFGSSTISTYSTRFPIRISPRTATRATTVVAIKKRVVFATTVETSIRAPTVQFDIPYTTIDLFFRTEIRTLLRSRHDTPSAQLVLDDVPTAALPSLRLYIEKINDHVKIDYSPTIKKLIISCASAEHNFMAGIGREIMALVNSDNNAFTANDPAYEIIENSDSGVPLGEEKHGRQPDGGLRLLNSGPLPPFLVWEVLDSQPLTQMIEKISHYFTQSHGRIRIVIVIQLIRQRPPKRKRRPSSIGDGSDPRRLTPATPDPDDTEPTLPLPPPPGRLIQGFYWIYKHALNAAGHREIQCAAERQEFYPTPPPGVLTLTWADILKRVPPALASKTLDIPFTILHERFRKIAAAAAAPLLFDDSDPEETWDLSSFPGIDPAVGTSSDPASEEAVSDGAADESFEGVDEPLVEGVLPRRSGRLARGEA